MKKNIVALFLIFSTFYTHTSVLRFLAKASVLSATAIGVKGAFVVREKGSVTDTMTFDEIKDSLTNERKIWNKFGFARRIFKPEQQPNMKTVVLKKESDGSIVLERDSSILLKNNGTLKKIDSNDKVIKSDHVYGPMAKSDMGLIATSVALLLASSPFVAGFVVGSVIA